MILSVLEVAVNVVMGILLLYALILGVRDIIEKLGDLFGWFRGREYRVKTTMIKDIIYEDRTERTKLRQLRVSKSTDQIQIDTIPEIFPDTTGHPSRRASVPQHYSLPGRTNKSQANKFLIGLMEDETIKPYRDHSVVLSYTMKEGLDDILVPPGVIARQPVGTRLLVYEAHIPPTRRYLREDGSLDKPAVEVYTIGEGGQRNDLSSDKWEVVGGHHDFDDGRGECDWLRVRISKPPKKGAVYIFWQWDGAPTRVSRSEDEATRPVS